MKKSNFLRKKFLNAPRGITLMSLVVTIIIMLILAGVAIRAITTDEGVIDEAKSAKTATEMADLREFVDIAILQAETVHTNAKMEDVIQQLIDNGIIEDASQVDIETGTITVGKNTLDGALADYVVTPEEKYYGNKNIKATPQTYFTFTVDETTGTATITGVKDEYAVKTYYNGEATRYTAVIKDGENYVTDVVIPYQYVDENGQKYTVTGIGDSAFGLKDDTTWDSTISNVENTFKSFVLPNTITTIGNYAFRGTTGLESINIPQAVASIGSYAFSGCSGLPASINISSATNIGNAGFFNCTNLNSVKLGEGLSIISDMLFMGCTNLSSINIPDSVIIIQGQSFRNCTNLSSLKIPESVTSFGNFTFMNCTSLESINIPANVTSIGQQTFRGCESLTTIVLPEGVTSIGNNAFINCKSLTSINIPEGVTSIGAGAFMECTSLGSIQLPAGITSIGSNLFRNCKSLNGIVLPSNVESIGDSAFYGCQNLTSINIPKTVTTIGSYVFIGCTSLSSINIPSSVATIGELVFAGWTASQTINCEILENEKPDTWNEYWDCLNHAGGVYAERKATLNWGVSM